MNLNQVRKRFRDLSGRYDLVNDDSSDTVDFLINSACEFLDRMSEVQKSYAVHYKYLMTGGWNLQVPYCRAVKEVWIASRDYRWQLEKKSLQDLLAGLMDEKTTSLEQGDPLYYSPILTRTVEKPPTGINNFVDTIVSQGHHFNAVLILPPPSQRLLVEIKGLFNSETLIADKDENFWTAVHPGLLLKAALHELEIFNQNQSKVEAWEKAITIELDGINKDKVEEDIAEISEMEG